jgi:hypothetical protein
VKTVISSCILNGTWSLKHIIRAYHSDVAINNFKDHQNRIKENAVMKSTKLWLGSEADHLPPTSANVRKAWIYTYIPPYVFIAYCLTS